MSADEVRRRVLGEYNRPPTEVIALGPLRWLGHVLRVSTDGLHFCVIFARVRHG